MHNVNLSTVDLISVITALEAFDCPTDTALIERLRALKDASLTIQHKDKLSAVIKDETLEYSGLFRALGELKYRTSQAPVCGEVDLKVLAANAVDAMNLQDAGLL